MKKIFLHPERHERFWYRSASESVSQKYGSDANMSLIPNTGYNYEAV
jgi:hypothetical protein